VIAAAHFLAALLLLLLYVLVPGAAFLTFTRFRFTSVLDAILACVGTGLAWTVFCVYTLLWVNGYTRATAASIALAPLGWLCYRRLTGGQAIPCGRLAADAPSRMSGIDRVAIGAVALFLLACFVDASTSPITNWDGDITWDKWATDWGRRQHLYGYLLGGYPQLPPMYYSILYKLSGAFQQPLPLEQFAVHAVHSLFAFVLLAGIVRLAAVTSVPAWPAVLFTFGHPVMGAAITEVSADLLLMALTVSAVTLYFSYLRGRWDSHFGVSGVAVPLLFAVCFTKGTGVLGLLFPLSFLLRGKSWSRTHLVNSPRARTVIATVVLPLVACLPFYAYQFAASPVPERLNPREVNFPASKIFTVLSRATASSHPDRGMADRVAEASTRLGGSFTPTSRWGLVMAPLLLLPLAVSFRNQLTQPLLLPSLAIVLVWFLAASYDLRNLLPVLPFAGILLSAGGVEIHRMANRRRVVLAVLLVCAALLAGVGCWRIAKRSNAVAELLRRDADGRSPMGRRLQTMASGPEARMQLFFPHEWPVHQFITSTSFASTATNIIATAHLYRWFPSGAYPLAHWSQRWIRPGDLFIGVEPHQPPGYDMWTKVYETGLYRVWLADLNPRSIPLSDLLVTGAPPPKVRTSSAAALVVDLHGGQGLIAYNVPDRDLERGSRIVWRVLVEADDAMAGVGAGFLTYDPVIVDITRTVVAVDTERADRHIIGYSGLVTLSGKPLSRNLVDGILVGIGSTADSGTLRLKDFRVSVYR
jgi:hypothetical protein